MLALGHQNMRFHQVMQGQGDVDPMPFWSKSVEMPGGKVKLLLDESLLPP